VFVIPIRTLTRELRLRTACRRAARTLAFIKTCPEISGARLESTDLEVERRGGFYRLALPDGSITEGTALHLLHTVGHLRQTCLKDELLGAPLIRAASVRVRNTPFLLVGERRSGKTTLVLRLIERGFAVEGDEFVAVLDATVVTCPRTLRVQTSSLDFVATLASRIRRAPFIAGTDGSRVYAVSPDIGGQFWRIAPSRVSRIVFLRPNHGGYTVAKPISTAFAFSRLMSQSLLPDSKAEGVARLRRIASAGPAWEMGLGDLAGAERHLTAIAKHVELGGVGDEGAGRG
jgi:hypothetical protein